MNHNNLSKNNNNNHIISPTTNQFIITMVDTIATGERRKLYHRSLSATRASQLFWVFCAVVSVIAAPRSSMPAGAVNAQARINNDIQHVDDLGSLAIISISKMLLDPWLCVPGFHRVCLFGSI